MFDRKLACAVGVFLLATGSAEAVQNSSQYSSIVIENGHRYLPQQAALKFTSKERRCRSLSFRLRNGDATFSNGSRRVVVARCRNVALPAIVAGSLRDESVLVVRSSTKRLLGRLRVTTVEARGVSQLKNLWPRNSYRGGAHFVLLNESRIAEQQKTRGQRVRVGDNGEVVTDRGWCWRRAWGPGEAHWKMNEPRWSGYGYIKEANDNRVFRPAGNATVKRDVDAFCRDNWAAHSAIKVPDSCTATINADHGRSYCCNAAMKAAGHVPKWVYTGDGAKPNWAAEKVAAWDSCP